jgi:hypothetical protein
MATALAVVSVPNMMMMNRVMLVSHFPLVVAAGIGGDELIMGYPVANV